MRIHNHTRALRLLLVPFTLTLAIAGCHPSNDDDPEAAAEALAEALAPREVHLITAEVR